MAIDKFNLEKIRRLAICILTFWMDISSNLVYPSLLIENSTKKKYNIDYFKTTLKFHSYNYTLLYDDH